jgi:hypothetical protein
MHLRPQASSLGCLICLLQDGLEEVLLSDLQPFSQPLGPWCLRGGRRSPSLPPTSLSLEWKWASKTAEIPVAPVTRWCQALFTGRTRTLRADPARRQCVVLQVWFCERSAPAARSGPVRIRARPKSQFSTFSEFRTFFLGLQRFTRLLNRFFQRNPLPVRSRRRRGAGSSALQIRPSTS